MISCCRLSYPKGLYVRFQRRRLSALISSDSFSIFATPADGADHLRLHPVTDAWKILVYIKMFLLLFPWNIAVCLETQHVLSLVHVDVDIFFA